MNSVGYLLIHEENGESLLMKVKGLVWCDLNYIKFFMHNIPPVQKEQKGISVIDNIIL